MIRIGFEPPRGDISWCPARTLPNLHASFSQVETMLNAQITSKVLDLKLNASLSMFVTDVATDLHLRSRRAQLRCQRQICWQSLCQLSNFYLRSLDVCEDVHCVWIPFFCQSPVRSMINSWDFKIDIRDFTVLFPSWICTQMLHGAGIFTYKTGSFME